MTTKTEQEIFEKYAKQQRMTGHPDGYLWFKRAIHEAYEAGEKNFTDEYVKDIEKTKAQTAPIFAELDNKLKTHWHEGNFRMPKKVEVGIGWIQADEYKALKAKYLKAKPERGATTGKRSVPSQPSDSNNKWTGEE